MKRVKQSRDPAARYHWHDWFAWRPVSVPGPRPGTRGIIWLERVKRRLVITSSYVEWQYSTNW